MGDSNILYRLNIDDSVLSKPINLGYERFFKYSKLQNVFPTAQIFKDGATHHFKITAPILFKFWTVFLFNIYEVTLESFFKFANIVYLFFFRKDSRFILWSVLRKWKLKFRESYHRYLGKVIILWKNLNFLNFELWEASQFYFLRGASENFTQYS